MAATSAAQPVVPNPQMVGNAFAQQYYNVLHAQPESVYKFYTDASKLTRAEVGSGGSVEIVESQEDIKSKVMSLNRGDVKAEIQSVDSQESLDKGVLVMVTGALSSKSEGKRNFVQSFFLAPQDKGYFVLNDIFRYLEEPQIIKHAIPALANGIMQDSSVYVPETPATYETLVEEHDVHEVPAEEPAIDISETDPLEESDVLETAEVLNTPQETPDMPPPEAEAPVQEAVYQQQPVITGLEPTSVETSAQLISELSEDMGEPVKKSYASILNFKRAAARLPAQPDSPEVVSKGITPVTADDDHEEAVSSISPPPPPPQDVSSPVLVAAPAENLDDVPGQETEVEGRSIFIKNLPLNVTTPELIEGFKQFGHIEPDKVQIRSGKVSQPRDSPYSCFAFIEFEEASQAQKAVEASPLLIEGFSAPVRIEKKLPNRFQRARNVPGRGDRPFRHDGGARGGRGFYTPRPGARVLAGAEREGGGRGGRGVGPTQRATSGGEGGFTGGNYAERPGSGGGDGTRRYGALDGGQGGGRDPRTRRGGMNGPGYGRGTGATRSQQPPSQAAE